MRCVRVCGIAYLKDTNDDAYDTSSNGRSKKCISHTCTTLGKTHRHKYTNIVQVSSISYISCGIEIPSVIT